MTNHNRHTMEITPTPNRSNAMTARIQRNCGMHVHELHRFFLLIYTPTGYRSCINCFISCLYLFLKQIHCRRRQQLSFVFSYTMKPAPLRFSSWPWHPESWPMNERQRSMKTMKAMKVAKAMKKVVKVKPSRKAMKKA